MTRLSLLVIIITAASSASASPTSPSTGYLTGNSGATETGRVLNATSNHGMFLKY